MKGFISLLLSTTLIIPYLIGLVHCIDQDHDLCFEEEVHIHELEVDCLTCDYLRVSFDYETDNQFLLTDQFTQLSKAENLQKVILSSEFINHLGSRGPPSDC